MWRGPSKKREQQVKTNLKIRTVLFIEQTKYGKLAKLVREVVTRMESMMGSGLRWLKGQEPASKYPTQYRPMGRRELLKSRVSYLQPYLKKDLTVSKETLYTKHLQDFAAPF